MALSYNEYVATASQTNFPVSFPYLNTDHVKVKRGVVEITDISWINPALIAIPPQTAGSVIRVYRVTPEDAPSATFQPGMLKSDDMNLVILQLLYLTQEDTDRDAINDDRLNLLDEAVYSAETDAAAAEVARIAAEVAAIAAEAGVQPSFATKAAAEAYAPTYAPDFLRIEGYTAAGDGGGALYGKVLTEPTHGGKLSITLDDAITVVHYEVEVGLTCRAYGAKCDGTTNDSAAALAQYLHEGRIVLPPATTTNITSWSTQSATTPVAILGERSIIQDLNATMFNLMDNSGLEVKGVTFVDAASTIVNIDSAANLDKFYWEDSGINGGVGINPAGDGCLDINHVKVLNCRFYNLTSDLLTLKAYVKKANIWGNIVDTIISSGSSAQAFELGKTQLSDQALCGDYSCIGNKVEHLEAQGTLTGEIHAFLLYGDRAVVSGNTIKDLSRTGVGADQEGIEGIYTKVRNVVISDNVLVAAGRESGTKNACITHKGVPLNSEATYPTTGEGSYFLITGNTVVGDGATAISGIRCEADHGIISNNHLALCFYSINLTVGALVENVQIVNNNCNQCTGPGGIRANVVCDGLVIDGNLVEKAASPIFTSSGGDAVVLDTSTRTGDADRVSISNNRLLGAWEYGIRTNFVSPSECNDFHEQGNQIIGAVYGLRNYPNAQIVSGYVAGNLMRATAAYRDQSTVLIYDGNYNNAVSAP
jgi:hypothetical protein